MGIFGFNVVSGAIVGLFGFNVVSGAMVGLFSEIQIKVFLRSLFVHKSQFYILILHCIMIEYKTYHLFHKALLLKRNTFCH